MRSDEFWWDLVKVWWWDCNSWKRSSESTPLLGVGKSKKTAPKSVPCGLGSIGLSNNYNVLQTSWHFFEKKTLGRISAQLGFPRWVGGYGTFRMKNWQSDHRKTIRKQHLDHPKKNGHYVSPIDLILKLCRWDVCESHYVVRKLVRAHCGEGSKGTSLGRFQGGSVDRSCEELEGQNLSLKGEIWWDLMRFGQKWSKNDFFRVFPNVVAVVFCILKNGGWS